MKKILLLLLFFSSHLNSNSQINNKTECEKLVSKGYTQKFCDYNTKYAYKSIPLESNFITVSSKFKLTKRLENSNQYDCKDGDVLRWAGVTFDNCIFDFSSSDKLDGIQLQISQINSPTSKAYIKEKMTTVQDYLTHYFGKPELFPGTTNPMWRGYKVYITLSDFQDTNSAVVAIYRTNSNVVDDL